MAVQVKLLARRAVDDQLSSSRRLIKSPDWISGKPIAPSWSGTLEYGGIGTNSDPASRRRALQEAEAEVSYRRQLLEDLEA